MEDLKELLEKGYISRRKHPSEELFILNYTAKAQYERLWNETTMSCRGLVVDSYGKIRARCFRKFFNHLEVASEVERRLADGLSFRAYEKMDGSLGILYWIRGEPFIATRGSFDSPQAIRANQILRSRPRPGLREDWTYLLEIIYPENRICLDYGARKDLVLLSAMDTESGEEVEAREAPFSIAQEVSLGSDFSSLGSMNLPNREGFVVRFDDGFRFKIKFDEYVRLHSIIFSVSSKSIWSCLKDDDQIPLDLFPDEIYDWVRREKEGMESAYASVVSEATRVFGDMKGLERKEFAKIALKYRYSSILFAMLDSKPYGHFVWKMLEPDYRTPSNEKIQESS
jgi:RNA ligase